MNTELKMIFFHPAEIVLGKSGSSVRPYNMLKAFQQLNISVEVVSGHRKSRENKIKSIIRKIESGEKYDLLYVENTTLPLELRVVKTKLFSYYKKYSSDKKFIQYCLSKNICCSYFYRDIYWDFPESYENSYSGFKKAYLLYYQKHFGRKELNFLRKKIQVFVPSDLFKEYLAKKYQLKSKTLSPGSTVNWNASIPKCSKLTIIYVGGVSPLYFSDYLISEFSKLQTNIRLILCCRKEEYIKNKERFQQLKQKEIHHVSGDALLGLYDRAHVALFPLKPSGYGKLSYSIKIPEYICNAKPIIAFKNNTCAGIIEKYQVGWTISEEKDQLSHLVKRLVEKPEEIQQKVANSIAVRDQFTWQVVAKKVIQINE